MRMISNDFPRQANCERETFLIPQLSNNQVNALFGVNIQFNDRAKFVMNFQFNFMIMQSGAIDITLYRPIVSCNKDK